MNPHGPQRAAPRRADPAPPAEVKAGEEWAFKLIDTVAGTEATVRFVATQAHIDAGLDLLYRGSVVYRYGPAA
jgi:hypothetical protein